MRLQFKISIPKSWSTSQDLWYDKNLKDSNISATTYPLITGRF